MTRGCGKEKVKEPMRLKGHNRFIYLGLILLFLVGLMIPIYLRFSRVKLGDREIHCNPRARINPRKEYHIRLWDYDRPILTSRDGYRRYLEEAIAAFRKQYPGVHVEVRLLEASTGPKELRQALENHTAPDLYCSAWEIPSFDWDCQIPVGFFLKDTEQELYYPGLLNLVRLYGVVCYFPYWTAPRFWIGNRRLLEKAGFNIGLLQQSGWSMSELLVAVKRAGPGRYLLVGDSGSNGFLTQLSVNSMKGLEQYRPKVTDIREALGFLDTLRDQKALPEDFDTRMLEYFLNGKAMVLAGANLSLYGWVKNYLRDRQSNVTPSDGSEPNSSKDNRDGLTQWDPVLLPVPHQTDAAARLLAENGVIAVYRSKFTIGDDQIAVAVKLGQFLSTYRQTRPWQELLVCPAAMANTEYWAAGTGLTPSDLRLIDQSLRHTSLLNLNFSPIRAQEFDRVIREYYLRKINLEIAESRLAQLMNEPGAISF